MALKCFDVVRRRTVDETFVVYQSDFLSHLTTRLVVPLVPGVRANGKATLRLNPVLDVDVMAYVLATHLCFAAQVGGLQTTGHSLETQRDAISAAFDFLTIGF